MNRSSSAWVGWACQPSPALITLAETSLATTYGAPAWWWRITTQSAPSACRVRMVSINDSPLVTEEVLAATLTVSAPSALAATSNPTRVRVLAS